MNNRVLVGYAIIDYETHMENRGFQYAASFEEVLIPAGKYPIIAYKDDLVTSNGKTRLGWRNYIEFKGTCVRSNVGNNPGDECWYSPMVYDYELAKWFIAGTKVAFRTYMHFELCDEWEITIDDGRSLLDNKRIISACVSLKDGATSQTAG